jgi:hypothetical protein
MSIGPVKPVRYQTPIISGVAQSTGTQSTSGTNGDLDSGDAPPPNEYSPLILYLVQDPSVLMLWFNLNTQPEPAPKE